MVTGGVSYEGEGIAWCFTSGIASGRTNHLLTGVNHQVGCENRMLIFETNREICKNL